MLPGTPGEKKQWRCAAEWNAKTMRIFFNLFSSKKREFTMVFCLGHKDNYLSCTWRKKKAFFLTVSFSAMRPQNTPQISLLINMNVHAHSFERRGTKFCDTARCSEIYGLSGDDNGDWPRVSMRDCPALKLVHLNIKPEPISMSQAKIRSSM